MLTRISPENLRFHWTYQGFRPGVSFKIGAAPEVTGTPYPFVEATGTAYSADGHMQKPVTGTAGMTGMHIWPMKGPGLEVHTHPIMTQLTGVLCKVARKHGKTPKHPLQHWIDLWPRYKKVAKAWGHKNFGVEIPDLMIICCAGIIDTAIWQMLGLANNCYPLQCATESHVGAELYAKLARDAGGVTLDDVIRSEPVDALRLWYTLGATEPLNEKEAVAQGRVEDGRPRHFGEYVDQLGLRDFKIKLGADAVANARRINAIDKLIGECDDVAFWADANEAVTATGDVQKFVEKLTDRARGRLMGVEQPFDRYLLRDQNCGLTDISSACAGLPVFIDEAVVTAQDVLWAKLQGAGGVCPKACRGVSESILTVMQARRHGLRSPFMDLTCRAESYMLSAGLAAWLKGHQPESVLEANAHQMFNDWTGGLEVGMPGGGPFTISDGSINTSGLRGAGFYEWVA